MEYTQTELLKMITHFPGAMGFYLWQEPYLRNICCTPKVPALLGMDRNEYGRITARDVLDCVYQDDREKVVQWLEQMSQTKKEIELIYRLYHKEKGIVWVKAAGRCLGSMDQGAVLAVALEDARNLQDDITNLLDDIPMQAYICDSHTLEVYFANKQTLAYWQKENYLGQHCYALAKNRKTICPWCSFVKMGSADFFHINETYDPVQKTYLQIDVRRIRWHARDCFVVFSVDVTERKRIFPRHLQYEELLSSIPIATAIYQVQRDDSAFVAMNSAFIQLLELDKNKQQERQLSLFCERALPEDLDKLTKFLSSVKTKPGLDHCVFRWRQLGKTAYRWLQLQSQSIPQSENSLLIFLSLQDITEKQAAKLARENIWHRYQAALTVAKFSVWEYDLTRNRLTRVGGGEVRQENEVRTEDETVPEAWLPYIVHDDRHKYLDIFRKILQGESGTEELWFRTAKQHQLRCERVVYTTVKNLEGHPVMAYGVSRDITRQKHIEEKYYRQFDLLNQETGKNLIVKAHANLTRNQLLDYQILSKSVIWDPDNIRMSYDECRRRFAATFEDEENRSLVLKAMDRKSLLKHMSEGETQVSLQYCRLHRQGISSWVQMNFEMFVVPGNDDIECFMYSYDITNTVLTQKVLEHLGDLGYDLWGLVKLPKQDTIYYDLADPDPKNTYREIISYDQYMRQRLEQDIPKKEQEIVIEALSLPVIQRQLSKNKIYEFSFGIQQPEGRRQKLIKFLYADAEHQMIFYCRSDVTTQHNKEQRQIRLLQKAKLEAEKANEAKGMFLASMSHDMRTPLNGILGFSRMALQSEDAGQKQDCLHKINLSGQLLLSLVNDTLELSQIESSKMILKLSLFRLEDIKETLLAVAAPLAAQKKIELRTDFPAAKMTSIYSDKLRLEEVCLNLLNNAVKFTPRGGQVDFCVAIKSPVGASCQGQDSSWVPRGCSGQCQCRITVRDTGIGIEKECLPRLFEPFFQERRPGTEAVGGTGLGLAIVKNIVDLMGGTIKVDSAVGKGTTFTVVLPLQCAAEQEKTPPPEKLDLSVLQGKKILLCEDNYLNTEIAKTLLEGNGMQVICASDGQEGLAKFQAAPPFSLAAILMDLRMPRLNGYETAASLRKMERADAAVIPIIAMSADTSSEDIKHCLDCGMDAHVSKPISVDKILRILVGCVQRLEAFKAERQQT